jgi:hypothetical protein
MTMRQLRRIARINDIDELNALDDASVANIKAGDDAFSQQAKAPENS